MIAAIDALPAPRVPYRSAADLKVLLQSEYSTMSGMMCGECAHEGLKMDPADPNEAEFTMHNWACAHGECALCMDKTKMLNLPPALTECTEMVDVPVWIPMPRLGSTPQLELAIERMTVAALCKKVVELATTASTHWLRTRYSKRAQRLGMRHMGSSAVHGSTDFAATVALTSKETGTVSKNNYANLNVWVLSHSPRDLAITDAEGNVTYFRVVTTDVWFFWGPTVSKSKFNDALFHNACLDSITEHYKKWFTAEGRLFEDFYIWTDNCFAQYRGCRNLYSVSQYFSKHNVRLHHSFGEVGQFKGPHDSAGKVLPSEIRARTEEGGTDYAPDARGCFDLSIKYKSEPTRASLYAELETGAEQDLPRLQHVKGLYGHNKYYIGYVTSDKAEHTAVSLQFPDNKVLFVDRDDEIDKFYTPVKNNQLFKDFRSTAVAGELEHRNMPCCCDRCREKQVCRYPKISGTWKKSTMERLNIKTPLEFKTTVTTGGKETEVKRPAARVVFPEGLAKVMGLEGAPKTVNVGSIVIVVQTDDDGGSVGVIQRGGVLFYTLHADGSYHKPAEGALVTPVAIQRYFVASQAGSKTLPASIALNDMLVQLLSEEAQLSFVPVEYMGNSADDEAAMDEEEEQEEQEPSGEEMDEEE